MSFALTDIRSRSYVCSMELLEREWALTSLAGALDSAARGVGRVVMVTGEPGIGKTWLVNQFLRDLDAQSRVLVGTCDDLSIPLRWVRFETWLEASPERSRLHFPPAHRRTMSRHC